MCLIIILIFPEPPDGDVIEHLGISIIFLEWNLHVATQQSKPEVSMASHMKKSHGLKTHFWFTYYYDNKRQMKHSCGKIIEASQ